MQETPKEEGLEGGMVGFLRSTLLQRPALATGRRRWACSAGERVLGGHLVGGTGARGPCSGSTQAAVSRNMQPRNLMTCLKWFDGWAMGRVPDGMTGIEAGAGPGTWGTGRPFVCLNPSRLDAITLMRCRRNAW